MSSGASLDSSSGAHETRTSNPSFSRPWFCLFMAEQKRTNSSRESPSPIWAAMRFVPFWMFSVRFLPSPSSV